MTKAQHNEKQIELENQILALTLPLTTEWHKLHSNVPVYLYHYTNAAGLNGIISSNRMWATNISCLNDSSEILYASDLIQQTLQESEQKYSANIVKDFLRESQRKFNAYEASFSAYVVCFCEEEDLLSQWRGYGSQGAGYSVGLESKYILDREPPKPLLRKVIYDKADQKTLIESRVSKLCELLNDIGKHQEDQDTVQMISIFSDHLRFLLTEMLCCFKNRSFAEEKEWRVVNLMSKQSEEQGTQLQFRASGGNLIPYLELDLSPSEGLFSGRLPITRIVHGPSLHPVPTSKSVELLLRKHGYVFVEVVGSNVPLRV